MFEEKEAIYFEAMHHCLYGGGALSHWDAIVLRAPPFKVRCMLQWDEGGGEDSSVDEGWGRSALKG